MPGKIEEGGNRYGKLIVISEHSERNSNGNVLWLCRCDCGNTAIIEGRSLRNGHTKSCGCLNKFPKGEASFNYVYSLYKRKSTAGNREFKLTKKQFKEITKQNCYYCDLVPSQVGGLPHLNGFYIYNGIDRLDNNVGYIIENCVPCCKECNFAKGTRSVEEFLSWLDRIAKYQGYY